VSSVASFESYVATSFVDHLSCSSSVQLLCTVWYVLLGVEDIVFLVC